MLLVSKTFLFTILVLMISCSTQNKVAMQAHDISHAIRLKPGDDLRHSIQQFVNDHHTKAGWIVTCAGSLTVYNIRFANMPDGTTGTGHFEIVSLTGTLSESGSHIHISIADSTGKTIGGHLLEGCKIYTTAELILAESSHYIFKREKDGSTPLEELQISEKAGL